MTTSYRILALLGCHMSRGKTPEESLRPIVLSLYDRTGNMVQPWLEAGYEAVTVDL
jgi:hypothetical protein